MSDLLGNFHTTQFKGAEYDFDNDILYLKHGFRKISHIFKNLQDLLKNLYLINLERVKSGYLTIFYSKPKFGRIGPKTKISSDLFQILCMSQYLKVLKTNRTTLF